ncbi:MULTISPECIES: glutamate 5-kinase [Brachybacterium]|uniref:Glutamate 5-kinase n=1 Tax=Brachybacterium alimentarium TaxID=47845 RepID=A0A2A3YIQ6_9MICO|nr:MULTISPECIES: glutamate 5-kinase [Brachybacterium]PCC38975.1 glutamate 5-kinase [Brachybacterium alimentarium]RCS63975.1 glutamate 5-kinase [Brachybacterium sp. JB7]RCS77517.1 glutamate 5-kinase [Brachybacterium alimentarium]
MAPSNAGNGAGLRQPARIASREELGAAERIVVKIGSSSLTDENGRLDQSHVHAIATTAAHLASRGTEVVIVSSGAIAAALGPLGLERRPTEVPLQQAAASVGQALLATAWSTAFADHGRITGQVLLTESDVIRPQTYRNVRSALESLLELGTLPVVNENDTTATHEIRFGDNDRLAALVAQLLGADALFLLTDVDALYTAPPREPGARRIDHVEDAARLSGVSIGSVGSKVGTGGMVTKLSAAQLASTTGTAVLMTSAAQFAAAADGADVGTFFPGHHGRRRSRLVWLRFATRGAGTLVLDEGAAEAVRSRRRSLLAVGIAEVRGTFPDGVPVDLAAPDGEIIARGLTGFSSDELRAMTGRGTDELREVLGERFRRPAVHRDQLVVL